MPQFKGLTWDHPRGYNTLAAAAAAIDPERDGFSLQWDKQPLEGFESHPIADLCARYDLVVLDHPHVGEAVAHDCLIPLEDVFGTPALELLEAATIGPCLSSYHFAERYWALPLDAASQVMALRPDLVDGPVPRTWDEVVQLSNDGGKVAMSLAGPHACLSFLSTAAALGEPPAERDPDVLVSREVGQQVFDLMSHLAARSPASVSALNPIGILGHMSANDDVALCPLIYGYVNYSADGPVRFWDAPRKVLGGRPGSTLGGTGIGVSRRCVMTPQLRTHLLWLLGQEAQTRFIPAHQGQPSRRSAWTDPQVNAHSNSFYLNTADTLEQAYVRPRHNGYIAFQSVASQLLRDAFTARARAEPTLDKLQSLYMESRSAGGER